jgi:hypothetical protein
MMHRRRLLGEFKFTSDELTFIGHCINKYGSGMHPEANEDSLPLFVDTYAKRCLLLAIGSDHLSDDSKEQAENLIVKLNA